MAKRFPIYIWTLWLALNPFSPVRGYSQNIDGGTDNVASGVNLQLDQFSGGSLDTEPCSIILDDGVVKKIMFPDGHEFKFARIHPSYMICPKDIDLRRRFDITYEPKRSLINVDISFCGYYYSDVKHDSVIPVEPKPVLSLIPSDLFDYFFKLRLNKVSIDLNKGCPCPLTSKNLQGEFPWIEIGVEPSVGPYISFSGHSDKDSSYLSDLTRFLGNPDIRQSLAVCADNCFFGGSIYHDTTALSNPIKKKQTKQDKNSKAPHIIWSIVDDGPQDEPFSCSGDLPPGWDGEKDAQNYKKKKHEEAISSCMGSRRTRRSPFPDSDLRSFLLHQQYLIAPTGILQFILTQEHYLRSEEGL